MFLGSVPVLLVWWVAAMDGDQHVYNRWLAGAVGCKSTPRSCCLTGSCCCVHQSGALADVHSQQRDSGWPALSTRWAGDTSKDVVCLGMGSETGGCTAQEVRWGQAQGLKPMGCYMQAAGVVVVLPA
jgi:hypothetical protein